MIDSNENKIIDRLQKDLNGFSKLAQILKMETGINLVTSEKNITLMASRLGKVLKRLKIESYKDYIRLLENKNPLIVTDFISAMTTNTTRFFRESEHFDVLKKIIPNILHEKKKDHNYELRIWCSASSTGQEVYTLLMVILGLIENLNQWSLKFLATDIDKMVLQQAANGIYTRDEVGDIPETHLQEYFVLKSTKTGDFSYQIKPNYRDMIRFAPFNLLSEKYPFQHPFDIIFCRNVLIYFDTKTVEQVIKNLSSSLSGQGYLFLGHSETGAMRSMKNFNSIANSAYQKRGEA